MARSTLPRLDPVEADTLGSDCLVHIRTKATKQLRIGRTSVSLCLDCLTALSRELVEFLPITSSRRAK